MARKPSERRHSEDAPADVNLIPIFGIMAILIPMIIYIFEFRQVRVQLVSAPRRGAAASAASGKAADEKELNLTVMIKKDQGFRITWDEALMSDQQAAPTIPMRKVDAEFCANPKGRASGRPQGCYDREDGCYCYDFPALYNELVKMKRRFSNDKKPEEKVNLTADMDVTFDVVSRTMDSVSCVLEQESYDDFGQYVKAEFKKGKSINVAGTEDPVVLCEPLFPKIVFALAE